MILILSPCFPFGDGKWFYVYSHLFKTTLKVTGALSTKFNWAGREDKTNKYIQSENDYMVEMRCRSVLDINLHSP